MLDIFHFSETGQVLSNTTPVTQSRIKPQQNNSKLPLAQLSTNTPHALNYTTSLKVDLAE